jgi:hypothetical protein
MVIDVAMEGHGHEQFKEMLPGSAAALSRHVGHSSLAPVMPACCVHPVSALLINAPGCGCCELGSRRPGVQPAGALGS